MSKHVSFELNGEKHTVDLPDDGTPVELPHGAGEVALGEGPATDLSRGLIVFDGPINIPAGQLMLQVARSWKKGDVLIIDDHADQAHFETMKHNARVAKEQHLLACPGATCEICASMERLKDRYYTPYHHEDLLALFKDPEVIAKMQTGEGRKFLIDSLGHETVGQLKAGLFGPQPFGMGKAPLGPARTPAPKPSRWVATPEQKRAKRKERKTERQARRRQRRA